MNKNVLQTNYMKNNSTLKSFSHQQFQSILSLNSIFYSEKLRALLGFNIYSIKVLHVTNLLKKQQNFLQVFLNVIKDERNNLENKLSSYWSFMVQKKMYKGLRYIKNLPVRGQRTHTNRKTARKLNGKSI